MWNNFAFFWILSSHLGHVYMQMDNWKWRAISWQELRKHSKKNTAVLHCYHFHINFLICIKVFEKSSQFILSFVAFEKFEKAWSTGLLPFLSPALQCFTLTSATFCILMFSLNIKFNLRSENLFVLTQHKYDWKQWQTKQLAAHWNTSRKRIFCLLSKKESLE